MHEQTISILKNQYDDTFQQVQLKDVISLIRGNNQEYSDFILKIRMKVGKAFYTDKLYKKDKATLMHASIHAHFKGRKEGAFKSFTNLLFLDFDDLTPESIINLKSTLSEIPWIVCFYESLSGSGIHAIALINEINDKENYHAIYRSLSVFFYNNFDFALCQGSNNITQIVAIPYDPNIYVNQFVTAYQFEFDYEIDAEYYTICWEKDIVRGCKGLQSKGTSSDSNLMHPPIKQSQRLYFSESYIDVHSPELINSSTKLDEGAYYVPSSYKKVRMHGRKHKIPEGRRKKSLITDLFKYILLNPALSESHYYQWIYNRNIMYCNPILEESDVNRVFNYVMKHNDGNALSKVFGKSKNVAFTSDCKLSKEQKCRLAARGKKIRNISNINTVIDQLISEQKIITRASIRNVLPLKFTKKHPEGKPVSIDTIKRHWKLRKSEIENHNKRIMENNQNTLKPEQVIRTLTGSTGHNYIVKVWINPNSKNNPIAKTG